MLQLKGITEFVILRERQRVEGSTLHRLYRAVTQCVDPLTSGLRPPLRMTQFSVAAATSNNHGHWRVI